MTTETDKKWYIVHTYSGYENKVKLALEERIRSLGKEEMFGEVLIPSETVLEMKRGVKTTSTRKFYPGYILVNMVLSDESWHIVKSTPKVTGFVGGAGFALPASICSLMYPAIFFAILFSLLL